MHRLELGKDLGRRFSGIDLFRDTLKLRLIFVQVGHADFQKAVERRGDHVVVEKLFGKNIRANAEVSV